MKTTITKAIFPVAGLGTRFLPATKANPKEMLAVIDKPIIQYAVEEAIEAGIQELIFVTSINKRSIEDHFDCNFELEALLEQKQDLEKLDLVRHTIPEHIKCTYIRQKFPLGLGHAVLCAEHAISNEPFVVILADDLLEPSQTNGCLKKMISQYGVSKHSIIAVEPIKAEDSKSYGIIEPKQQIASDLWELAAIIEKPEPEKAPSHLGVIGRYLFTPSLFKHLKNLAPGAGGEIQLTDAIDALIQEETVYAYACPSKRYDCGSKIGYIEATIALGLNHPQLKGAVKTLIQHYSTTL